MARTVRINLVVPEFTLPIGADNEDIRIHTLEDGTLVAEYVRNDTGRTNHAVNIPFDLQSTKED